MHPLQAGLATRLSWELWPIGTRRKVRGHQLYQKEPPGTDVFTYFWVDAFVGCLAPRCATVQVVNQHIADSFPMEWWSTRFAQAVGHLADS